MKRSTMNTMKESEIVRAEAINHTGIAARELVLCSKYAAIIPAMIKAFQRYDQPAVGFEKPKIIGENLYSNGFKI